MNRFTGSHHVRRADLLDALLWRCRLDIFPKKAPRRRRRVLRDVAIELIVGSIRFGRTWPGWARPDGRYLFRNRQQQREPGRHARGDQRMSLCKVSQRNRSTAVMAAPFPLPEDGGGVNRSRFQLDPETLDPFPARNGE